MDFFTPEFLRDRYNYDPITGVISNKTTSRPVGRITNNGYIAIAIRHPSGTKTIMAHRVAWQLYYGRNPADRIDHINNIKTDNRIANLRECCQRQNVGNYGVKGNNTSGYRGVRWDADRGKWSASIGMNGKKKNLGRYDTVEQAYAAYCAAASAYYGEFFDPEKGRNIANDNGYPLPMCAK